MTSVRRFFWGARHLVAGARFVGGRPALWPWMVVPVVLTVLLVWVAWTQSWAWAPWLLNLVLPRPSMPGFAQNLWNGLALVAVLWGFATATLLLYGMLGTVGAPFYDRLSMAVEVERGTLPTGFGWREELVAVGQSIGHSLLAAGLWVAVLALLALLNLLPGFGTVLELVGSWVATGWFFAREMLDGPTSRRGWSFGEKLALIRREPAACLGFGLASTVVLLVPLLNVFVLPVAVVGGTLLFLELESPTDPGPPPVLP